MEYVRLLITIWIWTPTKRTKFCLHAALIRKRISDAFLARITRNSRGSFRLHLKETTWQLSRSCESCTSLLKKKKKAKVTATTIIRYSVDIALSRVLLFTDLNSQFPVKYIQNIARTLSIFTHDLPNETIKPNDKSTTKCEKKLLKDNGAKIAWIWQLRTWRRATWTTIYGLPINRRRQYASAWKEIRRRDVQMTKHGKDSIA